MHLQSEGSSDTPVAALRNEASGCGPAPSGGMLLAAKAMLLLLLGAKVVAMPGAGPPLGDAARLPLLVISRKRFVEDGC